MSKCDNCRHIWAYAPDLSSPYGEYRCTKGHWEAGPNGAHNMPDDLEVGNIDPWSDCKDYEVRIPMRTLEGLLTYLQGNYPKPVSIPWDWVKWTFSGWYHSNPQLFGSRYMKATRDYSPPIHIVMEDAAKAWGEQNGYSVTVDHREQRLYFWPKKSTT